MSDPIEELRRVDGRHDPGQAVRDRIRNKLRSEFEAGQASDLTGSDLPRDLVQPGPGSETSEADVILLQPTIDEPAGRRRSPLVLLAAACLVVVLGLVGRSLVADDSTDIAVESPELVEVDIDVHEYCTEHTTATLSAVDAWAAPATDHAGASNALLIELETAVQDLAVLFANTPGDTARVERSTDTLLFQLSQARRAQVLGDDNAVDTALTEAALGYADLVGPLSDTDRCRSATIVSVVGG